MSIQFVMSLEQLRERIRQYNEEPSSARERRAEWAYLVVHWVFDPYRLYFAPARYAALANADDEAAMQQGSNGSAPSDHITHRLGCRFSQSPELQSLLNAWAQVSLNINFAAYKGSRERLFVRLPMPDDTLDLPLPAAGLRSPTEQRFHIVRTRQGQQVFREALLSDHDNVCVVSGCSIRGLLEAAHIDPYSGIESQSVENGFVLRADLHSLFDQMLLAVRPDDLIVQLHPSVQKDGYQDYHGKALGPKKSTPSRGALQRRWEAFRSWLR